MKRMMIALMALFCAAVASFAEESKFAEAYLKANSLIETGRFLKTEGRVALQEVAKDLSMEWRMIILDKNEKTPWLGCGLNLIIPSLGSWVMGDYTGALITDGGIIGGAIIYGAGVCMLLTTYTYDNYGYYYRTSDQNKIVAGGALVFSGAAIFTGFYLASLVMPFIHCADYNTKLKQGLGLADAGMPVYTPLADLTTVRQDNDFRINFVSYQF